jgi:hypothetical protein
MAATMIESAGMPMPWFRGPLLKIMTPLAGLHPPRPRRPAQARVAGLAEQFRFTGPDDDAA